MNSSSLAVETPVKVFIREKLQTPFKIETEKRFAPSESCRDLLKQIARIHRYQFHDEFDFKDLTRIEINQDTVKNISNYILSEEPDLSDLVLRIEEIVLSENKFNNFVKNYISEEFLVDSSYSFLVLCILNYKDVYKLELEQAIFELQRLSSSNTLCELCITGDQIGEKNRMSQIHNLSIYGNILTTDIKLDDLSSDDSFTDKHFSPHSSSVSTDEFGHSIEPTKCLNFNPFDSSSEISCPNSKHSSQIHPLNSTELNNPFSETSSDSAIESNNNCFVRKGLVCEHCGKSFYNSHNRKLHYIRENLLIIGF